jgi:hypothetical protein
MVARDYAGTALLAIVTVVLVTGGLIHRPGRVGEENDRAAALAAVHAYVRAQAPAFSGAPDMVREETDLYRVCVYGGGRLPLCLYVNTSRRPAVVTRDPSREPNRHN